MPADPRTTPSHETADTTAVRPSEERPTGTPFARARLAWLAGDDEAADALAADAYQRALANDDRRAAALADAVRAVHAAAIDEDERAEAILATLAESGDPDTLGLGFVARVTLARARSTDMPVAVLATDEMSLDVRAEVLLAAAAVARLASRPDEATDAIDRATALLPPASIGACLAAVEAGELILTQGKPHAARDLLLRASSDLEALGLRRAAGRVLLRYAQVVAPALPGAGPPPAVWLARARELLGDLATYRDRAALRSGFRTHGRRLPDAALTERTLSRVDAIERAVSVLRGRVAHTVDRSARAFDAVEHRVANAVEIAVSARQGALSLPTRIAPLSREIEHAAGELLELVGAGLVERDRLRSLARALAALDGIDVTPQFAAAAARVVADVLQAESVVIAVVEPDAPPVPLGMFSTVAPASPDVWGPAIEAGLRLPSTPPADDAQPSLRGESRPRGPVLVVPVRSTTFSGALYADKLARGGHFRDADVHLASLASEYLAQGFARLSALAAERAAFAQLGATLEAIRDGVLALDATGVILRVNAAAVRMLRTQLDGLVGRRMDELPQLAPLWTVLSAPQRPDGVVARLAHGSVVVTARPILAEGSPAGTVATLVELDRAQRIAARITHTRPRYGFHDVIGSSRAMEEVLRVARQAAMVDASVLITGESGTGKEVIAQAIHTGGPRANEPFVGINCAALPRELLEAELFGYERGAFTGARSEGAVGKFEQAAEGSILLDEIGDMPLDMQVKLLRVLQERVVVRLGGTVERPFSARVLATTHRSLDEGVEKGTFRLDLLYRLRVLHIHLPPLRERPGDIREIALQLVRRVGEAQRKAVRDLSPQVLDMLTSYAWPGNVRELANVIEREVSLIAGTQTRIERFEVPLGSGIRSDGWATESPTLLRNIAAQAAAGAAVRPDAIVPLAEVERRAFLDALSACGGNVTRAAKALGVSRATFYVKLREWNVTTADEPGPETMRRIRVVEEKK